MTLLLPQCRLTSTSLKPELSRDTNTEIQEYRIRGTGAGGVRLHLDQSAGPFTNLPQYYDLFPTFSRQPPRQPGSSKSKKRAGGEAQWYIIDPP